MTKTAIILLNQKGIETARKIQAQITGAEIWGLEDRVIDADNIFTDTGAHLRGLYENGSTIIGLCATGILIRALAPCLSNKQSEPPLLAVSDDGAIIIPLLGGLTGANELASSLSKALGGSPAITASGARHYNLQLEAPPHHYTLANREDAKRITSDILNGTTVMIDGTCPWLTKSKLPLKPEGDITLRISPFKDKLPKNGLLYHPKTLLVEIASENTAKDDITDALNETGYAESSLAAIITLEKGPIKTAKRLAAKLNVPLRIITTYTGLNITRRKVVGKLALIELKAPPAIDYIGRAIGRVSIVGLGPGKETWRTPEVKSALEQAQIIIGYKTYIDMVPVRFDQRLRPSDNRVEMDRAIEALNLARSGHSVAIVSSGDPGIFAMASAVLEAIDNKPNCWPHIDLDILPGLTAMQGAAALSGAPLGHDFAVISLSDIRKPFEIIEQRLIAVAKSDMVIAIYNPASKTRREQLDKMKQILLEHKAEDTPVLIAKNVGRDGEHTEITTLSEFDNDSIDMRTMLIIGSSKTRIMTGPDGQPLLYTPRSYEPS